MVRAKNVLLPLVELFFVDHFERHAEENEHELSPPPVKFSDQSELSAKHYRNEKQEEKNHKKNKKYYEAI
jgi:hypothetical protein